MNTASVHWRKCDKSVEQATKGRKLAFCSCQHEHTEIPSCPLSGQLNCDRSPVAAGVGASRQEERGSIEANASKLGAVILGVGKWAKCKCGARSKTNPSKPKGCPGKRLVRWPPPKNNPPLSAAQLSREDPFPKARPAALPGGCSVKCTPRDSAAPLGLRAQRMEEDCTKYKIQNTDTVPVWYVLNSI